MFAEKPNAARAELGRVDRGVFLACHEAHLLRVLLSGKPGAVQTSYGLRKAACRRLADAGCTANEIMSVSGHKNLKEVTTYTEAASRSALEVRAMNNILSRAEETETGTEIVKPASKV